MPKLEIEDTIKYQNNLLNHQDNLLEKYVRERSNIRGLLKEHATGKMSAEMVVSYLRMYVKE